MLERMVSRKFDMKSDAAVDSVVVAYKAHHRPFLPIGFART